MKYRVLDDIVYYEPGQLNAPKQPRTATAGDVVEVNPKDAIALLKRGAIAPITEEPK